MSEATKSERMILLHRYDTAGEVWIDPEEIALVERLPAIDQSEVGKKPIPARTKILLRVSRADGTGYGSSPQEVVLVSELPGAVAASSSWRIQTHGTPPDKE